MQHLRTYAYTYMSKQTIICCKKKKINNFNLNINRKTKKNEFYQHIVKEVKRFMPLPHANAE